ncbi:MAG: YqhA family protein [Ktedonobacteraceae bacterium]
MLRRILAGSRYLVVIAIVGAFLISIALLIYGGLAELNILFEVFAHPPFTVEGAKHLEVGSIEIIDLFLLATVLYIIALGLYELFIDASLPVLPWLVITNLDDLKTKLTSVITVLLAVTFLAYVVEWDGNTNILALGVSVGLVLFSLGYFLARTTKSHDTEKSQDEPPT